MFKKFSFLMLAAAALLASCSQNEDGLQTRIDGTSQTVTITANTGGSMTTRATNAQGDNEVTRCLIQIFEKTGPEGQELQPMEGYETPQLMEGSETGGFSATVTFNTAKKYSILFWADEGENAYTYDGTEGLQSVTVAENVAPGIAYAGSTEWSSTNGTTVGVDLNHAVAKVTLRSTTAVPADRTVTLTRLTEYSTFNLLTKAVTTKKTFTHEKTGTGEDGDIMVFYALVDGETQNLTLNAGGADVEISNVPLAMNKHVILTGDVANAGLATVTFEAKVVEDWDETTTITLIPDNAVKITSDNSTISDDGNYVVSGTFNNPITVTDGNPTIYLDGASVSVSNGNAINITGGTPTIHVVGTGNSASSSNNTGIAVSGGATLTIKGSSTESVLTATGSNGGAGIGSPLSGTAGGNISIDNVRINATGGSESSNNWGGAGIGSSCNGNCGDVTITDAVIVANGGNYSPGIGMGYGNTSQPSIGTITITHSDVTAKAGSFASAIGLPYSEGTSGANPDYKAGQIIITTGNLETFLSKLATGGTANASFATYAQRIGVGSHSNGSSPSILNQDGSGPWKGVEINGEAYPNGVD